MKINILSTLKFVIITVIPPEIKKKGTKAVDLYVEALMEGKTKIPRCNLVVLGEEMVGKTSLYRLLVQKGFDPNQDSTRGIDNTIVEALDRRNIMAGDWSEKDDQMVQEHVDQQFVRGVIEALPSDLAQSESGESGTKSKSYVQSTTDKKLYAELSKLEPSVRKVLKSKKRQPKVKKHRQAPPKSQPHVPKRQVPSSHLPPEDEQPRLKDVAESMGQDPPSPPRTHKSIIKRFFKFGKKQSHQTQAQQPEEQIIPQSQLPPITHEDARTKTEVPIIDDEDPSHSTDISHPAEAVSNRQALMINEELVTGASRKKVNPVLLLNALDFAGQKEYRPMHHCFLTRRAMYLVVFNLQHIFQYLEQKKSSEAVTVNPFEEIRYWLHSIHIHTLPAVPGKEKRALKNVCLVGTHRAPPNPNKGKPIPDEELKEINDLIMEEIKDDDRCLSHLHFMGS